MPTIFVIIVTYNGMQWIEDCLKTVSKSTIPVSTIVIDNMSTDGTVDCIKTNFTEVILLEQTTNLGFGKANNLGISYALKHHADYVFLLNQDAFVEENTIEKLIKTAQNNPEYGIISPIHLNGEGTKLEWYFASYMTMDKSPDFYSDYVLNKETKEIYETQFVNAAAWLLPRNILNEIGGFDPMFWHYGEDNNYCQRIHFHKFKIGVSPSSFIRHDGKIRTWPEDYIFSTQYFNDYVKELQISYGNINIVFEKNCIAKEKKKMLKNIVKSIIRCRFSNARNFYKQYQLIAPTFEKIIKSRNINSTKAAHYI
jgi:GT2 family glycosyltransferase